MFGFFLNYLRYPGVSKDKVILILGVIVTPARSKIYKHEVVKVFLKMKSKNYQSKMKQNNSTELLGYSSNHSYNKNGPPDPLDPNRQSFPDFLDVLQFLAFWLQNLALCKVVRQEVHKHANKAERLSHNRQSLRLYRGSIGARQGLYREKNQGFFFLYLSINYWQFSANWFFKKAY